MAGTKIRVMIVDDIAETREQLRKLLSFDSDIEVVAMAASGEDAVKLGGQSLPDVVLMDINLPGMDGIAATAKLLEVHPGAQVVMLSVQGDMDYMRKAMMAGARDYLTKPPSADELIDTIHRIYKVGPRPGMAPAAGAQTAAMPGVKGVPVAPPKRGKLITIFSPKGGTGCTTIAVNLALVMQTLLGTDTKICLIDASLQFGDVTTFMKLQATRTLIDLAPRVHELDTDLLNTIVVSHPSGLKVLAAPPTPEDAEIFREEGIEEETGANRRLKLILDFVRNHFDYVIVDTSHLVDDSVLAALDVTDLLLLVTRPIIPEIRGVRLFASLLNKIGFQVQKVGLVINGVDVKLTGIEPGAVEKAVMPAMVHIPLDERTALKAANYGVPIVSPQSQNARTPIGQAFGTLGQQVVERLKDPEDLMMEEPQKRGGRLL